MAASQIHSQQATGEKYKEISLSRWNYVSHVHIVRFSFLFKVRNINTYCFLRYITLFFISKLQIFQIFGIRSKGTRSELQYVDITFCTRLYIPTTIGTYVRRQVCMQRCNCSYIRTRYMALLTTQTTILLL